MLTRFILYGLAGWCLEIFWTGLGSLIKGDVTLAGRTYIWMFPIYGMAIFLEPIHYLVRSWPFLARGFLYMLLIFAAEYLSGLLLRRTIGLCPWDYSHSPYSVDGLIRLDYAPAWFIAGLLFEQLHWRLLAITP